MDRPLIAYRILIKTTPTSTLSAQMVVHRENALQGIDSAIRWITLRNRSKKIGQQPWQYWKVIQMNQCVTPVVVADGTQWNLVDHYRARFPAATL